MQYNILSCNEQDTTLYNTSYNMNNYYSYIHNITKYLSLNGTDITAPILTTVSMRRTVSVSTDRVYDSINANAAGKYNPSFYPMAVRYISAKGTYVVERPPFQLEVDYRMGSAHSGHPKMPPVKIWVPWTVMVFSASSFAEGNFSEAQLYFSDTSLQSLDQHVVPCFYPNSYNDGRICFSNSLSDFSDVLDMKEFENFNISYIYNYIFNNYMMGGWNSDLHSSLLGSLSTHDLSVINSYPELKLFLEPSSDQSFYEKLSTVFPKELFSKLKRFYKQEFNYFKSRISPEKLFVRNFGIFSAFTLEQKLNFISSIKSLTTPHLKDRYALSSIIKRIDKDDSIVDSSSKNALLTSINSDYFNYDYSEVDYHVYFYNYNPQDLQNHRRSSSLFSSNLCPSLIGDMITYFNDEEPIAFAVNAQTGSYDIITNYSAYDYIKEIIDTVVAKAQEFLQENSSDKNKQKVCTYISNEINHNFTPDKVEHALKYSFS